jgi:hypothetical protein
MSAIKLYNKYSMAQLVSMDADVSNDPKNRNPPGSILIFNAAATKKLRNISQAITWHLADKRKTAGNPVPVCGYSGRNTNH